MANEQQAIQEFELLSLLTKLAEVLKTDTLQFEDCCIQLKGGKIH